MLSSIPVSIAVGTVLGFLTGLGTGGGSLLLLWLTLVVNMEHPEAKLINLMFFIPAATVSCCIRCFQGEIPFQKIILPALAGCITAALLAKAGRSMDTYWIQKVFGILLIAIGIRELCYRKN